MGEHVFGYNSQWSVTSTNKEMDEVKLMGDGDELCISDDRCCANILPRLHQLSLSPNNTHCIPYHIIFNKVTPCVELYRSVTGPGLERFAESIKDWSCAGTEHWKILDCNTGAMSTDSRLHCL